MRFVVDTHCLLWYLEADPRLSDTSRKLFDEPQEEGQVVIPTIVVTELLYLTRKFKLLPLFEEAFKLFESQSRFELFPLDATILKKVLPLQPFEIHDAIIVATAMYLKIPLMTLDHSIVTSGLVEILEP